MSIITCRADLMELAAAHRRPLDTLHTLDATNDPFMVDLDSRSDRAEWIADIFNRLNLPRRVHVRLIHYKLVSQKKPVLQTDGTPYVNSEQCYNRLVNCTRDARYLGLIPADAIIDRRNPEPTINHVDDGGDLAAEIEITAGRIERHPFGSDYSPPEIELPEVSLLQEPHVGQAYHLEIWIEKSTANDVLLPLGLVYGINVATFTGEVSATACKNLVNRAVASGKPVRVLHITDFDPAGQHMPVSAAVKIDFFARQADADLDIRLEHVALTEEQCIEYHLPRTPIKTTEARAAGFEARYGEGATELDALEALHPGALGDIMREHILRYYDPDLRAAVRTAVDEYTDELDAAETEIEDRFSEQLADIDGQRERIAAAFGRVHGPARAAYDRITSLARARYDRAIEQVRAEVMPMEERLVAEAQPLLDQMKAGLEEEVPDPDAFAWPEPAEGDEDDDALYDSTRDYLEQVDIFRERQGKDADVRLSVDRMVTRSCPLCGESFTSSKTIRVYCSQRCRDKARRGRGPRRDE
jgi:hypothetical protein